MTVSNGSTSTINGANRGHPRSQRSKAFPPGIHVPSLTFFGDDERQEIDWTIQEKHFSFLVQSGLHGSKKSLKIRSCCSDEADALVVVLAGTNGEAATLTTEEKALLVTKTRQIATENGRPDLPITLGCSGGCTRDVVDQTIAARDAGADFALVLVPSYFHFAMDQAAIISFFQEVADRSPIGVVIYNFPGVVAGLDVNSEMLEVLGRHENIVGVKLTCGGIAKVTRAAAAFSPEEFAVLAGQSDWLVPGLSVGAVGCITGCANVFPKTCVKIFDLYMNGEIQESTKLQKELAKMEWGFAKGGINGTKWVVAKLLGYPETSADCRRPYPKYADEEKQKWITNQVSNLVPIEKMI